MQNILKPEYFVKISNEKTHDGLISNLKGGLSFRLKFRIYCLQAHLADRLRSHLADRLRSLFSGGERERFTEKEMNG